MQRCECRVPTNQVKPVKLSIGQTRLLVAGCWLSHRKHYESTVDTHPIFGYMVPSSVSPPPNRLGPQVAPPSLLFAGPLAFALAFALEVARQMHCQQLVWMLAVQHPVACHSAWSGPLAFDLAFALEVARLLHCQHFVWMFAVQHPVACHAAQHFWGPASYLLGLCSISDYQPRMY